MDKSPPLDPETNINTQSNMTYHDMATSDLGQQNNTDQILSTDGPADRHQAIVHSPTASYSSNSTDASTTAASPVHAGESKYMPIKTAPTEDSENRLKRTPSGASVRTQDDIFRVLSRRRTSASGKSDADVEEEQAEIERLMSRMFGRGRQAHSEEEKTRHVGVVFRGLTVKGLGLGAALQPSVGDIFLGLPRLLRNLFTKGPK